MYTSYLILCIYNIYNRLQSTTYTASYSLDSDNFTFKTIFPISTPTIKIAEEYAVPECSYLRLHLLKFLIGRIRRLLGVQAVDEWTVVGALSLSALPCIARTHYMAKYLSIYITAIHGYRSGGGSAIGETEGGPGGGKSQRRLFHKQCRYRK